MVLVAVRGDREDRELLGERAPQRALLRPSAATRSHPCSAPASAATRRAAARRAARARRRHGRGSRRRSGRDPRAEQLLAQLDHVAARDTVAHRQRRDRRLQARPERAPGDLRRQLARALDAAVGAAHALAAMLGHRGPRSAAAPRPDGAPARRTATRSASTNTWPQPHDARPVLDDLIDRPRRQQLTTLALMTRLAALRRGPSGPCPPPRRRARRILARRQRRVARVASRSSRSSCSTRASSCCDPTIHRATAPRRRPHARRHRSPPPQPAPHPRIRQRRVMSPNQLNAYPNLAFCRYFVDTATGIQPGFPP